MKHTKAQARAAYDNFFGTLRNLNGGTTEENARMAPACLAQLEKDAAEAALVVANPNKALAADAWFMEALGVTIPARLASFRERYFPAAGNVVPFIA